MNVTLSLDDELVKRVRKIAANRETTLTGMIRAYLQSIADEDPLVDRKKQEKEAFLRTVREFSLPMGERTWTRAELYERPKSN